MMARRKLIINSDEDDFSAGSSLEDEGEDETRMMISGGPDEEPGWGEYGMGTNDRSKLTDGDSMPGKHVLKTIFF